MRRDFGLKRVGDPRHQGGDIGGFHRRAAPDAEPCGRVAVGADVIGDPGLFQPLGDGLHARRGDAEHRQPDRRDDEGRGGCAV